MCYSAYATRRYESNLVKFTEDKANALKMNITKIFKTLKRGNIGVHMGVARDTIAFLSRKAPFEIVDDTALVGKLFSDYSRICAGLNLLDALAVDIQVDKELLNYLYETVYNLHQDVASGVMWHDILPYAPLSLMGLRKLRDRITGDEEYRPLASVLGSIKDIERWLSLPPRRLVFPAWVKDVAHAAMQEVSEAKIQKLMDPGVSASSAQFPHPENMTMTKVDQPKLQEDDHEKEQNRKAAEREANLTKEKADHEAKEAAQREADAKEAARKKAEDEKESKEKAEAVGRMIEEMREQEGIKAREAEKAMKQKHAQDVRAAQQHAKLLEETEANKLREAEAAKLEQLTLQKQLAKQRLQTLKQAAAAKEVRRTELLEKASRQREALRFLVTLEESGQVSSAKLDEMNCPTKQGCVQILTELWDHYGDHFATIFPQLAVDHEVLLEFDVNVITEAQCVMHVLKHRGGSAQDLDMTGWQLRPLVQFQSQARSSADKAGFADMKTRVDSICSMLEEAERTYTEELSAFLNSSTSTQQSQNTSLGASMDSNTTMDIDHDIPEKGFGSPQLDSAPAPITNKPHLNPFLDPARTQMGPNGLPIPDAEFVAQHSPFVDPFFNTQQATIATDLASPPRARNAKECRFGNKCNRGADCNYTHSWDAMPENSFVEQSGSTDGNAIVSNSESATNMRNPNECKFGNRCNRGEDCRYTHPWDVIPKGPLADRITKDHAMSGGIDSGLNPQMRNAKECRFGSFCSDANCPYMHPSDVVPDKSMDTPCHHFFKKGTCRYGDNCRLSHDTVRFGPPADQQLQKPLRTNTLPPLDLSTADVDWQPTNTHESRSSILCHYGKNCTKKNCPFKHDIAATASTTSQARPSANPGWGKSILGEPRHHRNGVSKNGNLGQRGGHAPSHHGNAPRLEHHAKKELTRKLEELVELNRLNSLPKVSDPDDPDFIIIC
ncbi:hypothetical protein N0V83_000356 [Neocucurbitaria cava]|uniref:C3H1-type domain-containing protein n=1 Tax=Neocucurbitaria cava TaxID=798079 RepID=A0A9W8YHP5_9PLEO|nr:hypothetical protein N0V83_000356 [Neocucurbitaria cava]